MILAEGDPKGSRLLAVLMVCVPERWSFAAGGIRCGVVQQETALSLRDFGKRTIPLPRFPGRVPAANPTRTTAMSNTRKRRRGEESKSKRGEGGESAGSESDSEDHPSSDAASEEDVEMHDPAKLSSPSPPLPRSPATTPRVLISARTETAAKVTSHTRSERQNQQQEARKSLPGEMQEEGWPFDLDFTCLLVEFMDQSDLELWAINAAITPLQHFSSTLFLAIERVQRFPSNPIYIMTDNTASMEGDAGKKVQLQKDMAREVLEGVDRRSLIYFRPVDSSVGFPQFLNGVQAGEALNKLGLFFSELKYHGSKTPLCSAIWNLVREESKNIKSKTVIVLTDGEETVAKGFQSIKTDSGESMAVAVTEHNKKVKPKNRLVWDRSRRLISFLTALMELLTGSSTTIFLPTIVGLDMTLPPELDELIPIYSVKDKTQVRQVAQRIKESTISKQSGGGKKSQSSTRLADQRQHRSSHTKKIYSGKWSCFPPADDRHCAQLLTSQRRNDGLGLIPGWPMPAPATRSFLFPLSPFLVFCSSPFGSLLVPLLPPHPHPPPHPTQPGKRTEHGTSNGKKVKL